jgi:hypothetical protein
MEMGILVATILLLGYAIATVGDIKVIIKSLQGHTKNMIKCCDNIINKNKGGK